jgi:FdhE protein
MRESWDTRLKRAEDLASRDEASGELLVFYGKLLAVQRDIYEYLTRREGWLPSGELERDLDVIMPALPWLLGVVETAGPAPLAEEAARLSATDDDEIRSALLGYWRQPSDVQFFAKVLLQPYANWMVETGARPLDRGIEAVENRCPLCAGKPQVSYLLARESEGSARYLQCSNCLSSWNLRRLLCTNCGEEDPARLAYFQSPQYDHVRIDTCDTCKYYIKSVDLTRLGLAVPLVDEVAAASLDIWAKQQGLTKIELNVVGL